MKEIRGSRYPLWWCSKLRLHYLTISSSYSQSKTTFLTFAMFIVRQKTCIINTFAQELMWLITLMRAKKTVSSRFFSFSPGIRCKWISGLRNTLTYAKTNCNQNKNFQLVFGCIFSRVWPQSKRPFERQLKSSPFFNVIEWWISIKVP